VKQDCIATLSKRYRHIHEKIQKTGQLYFHGNKKTAFQDLSATGLEGCLPASGSK
jgi:hypothetical protein